LLSTPPFPESLDAATVIARKAVERIGRMMTSMSEITIYQGQITMTALTARFEWGWA